MKVFFIVQRISSSRAAAAVAAVVALQIDQSCELITRSSHPSIGQSATQSVSIVRRLEYHHIVLWRCQAACQVVDSVGPSSFSVASCVADGGAGLLPTSRTPGRKRERGIDTHSSNIIIVSSSIRVCPMQQTGPDPSRTQGQHEQQK